MDQRKFKVTIGGFSIHEKNDKGEWEEFFEVQPVSWFGLPYLVMWTIQSLMTRVLVAANSIGKYQLSAEEIKVAEEVLKS